VLENLCKVIAYVREYENDFVQQVTHNILAEQTDRETQAKRQLEQQTRRITEIDAIIKRLYEDNVVGKLSAERFAKMNADYEREQKTLEKSTTELRKIVDTCEEQNVNIRSFIKTVHRYIEPTELTPDILHELVSKIVVHAPDMSTGHRTQQIDVHYNFVGEIALSSEIAKRETA
jgi:site-specific DNA recombinase